MMPTAERMEELIASLASWKANTFVFEYDDRFPFERHPALVTPTRIARIGFAV